MQGRDGDDGRLGDDLGRALRRSEDEARPREEFARGLRERFVDGSLAPAAQEPSAPARALPIPRWIAYPVAAAALVAAFAISGALGPRDEPQLPVTPPTYPTVPVVADPQPAPTPPASPADAALVAAERRVGASPALAGRTWQSRVVEGRPWLLPSEAAFADATELKSLSLYMARADAALAEEFPGLAKRSPAPVVAVVAPSRRDFEALVAPRIAPVPLNEFTIAFSLDDLAVLLVSPGALEPGGPLCEEMDVVHEAVHAWLRARRAPGAALPLWVDEGLAGAVSQGDSNTRNFCRKVLSDAASYGMDPFTPGQVLETREYGAMARQVASRAPCEERPYSLVPVFHAHAEGLALFLLDGGPESARRAAFQAWLQRVLDGRAPTASQENAVALGFESVEALFLARDEWLRR